MSSRKNNQQIKQMEDAIAGIQASTKNLQWAAKDLVGNVIVGYYEDTPLFEIKRGTLVYTMTILDKSVAKRNKLPFSTSTQLNRVKNKADKICQEHYIPHLKNNSDER